MLCILPCIICSNSSLENLDASVAEEKAACKCPAVTLSATDKVSFSVERGSLMLSIIFLSYSMSLEFSSAQLKACQNN